MSGWVGESVSLCLCMSVGVSGWVTESGCGCVCEFVRLAYIRICIYVCVMRASAGFPLTSSSCSIVRVRIAQLMLLRPCDAMRQCHRHLCIL